MHSTRYVYTFVAIMTTVSALLLAGLFTVLKPIHDKNEAVFNKKQVLKSLATILPKDVSEYSGDEIQSMFDVNNSSAAFNQLVLDANGDLVSGLRAEDVDLAQEEKKEEADRNYPLYVYKGEGKEFYVTAVRGKGLWDKIWGFVAFESDLNTIVGVAFDHAGETPGLGAEIKDNAKWVSQFQGEKTLSKEGEFVSVKVKKGGADKNNKYAVDGITGATITANGVEKMMKSGLLKYQPYFATLRK